MIALPALVVLLVAAWALWRRGTGPLGPAQPDALMPLGVPDTAATRELLGRWRDRSRRWRSVVTFPAVLFSVVGSLRQRGQLDIGLVNTVGVAPLWTDPLVVGLLALTLGGLAAELHHLRRVPAGPRSAELRPREVSRLRRTHSRVRRAALVGLIVASASGHVALVVPGRAEGSPSSLLLAVAVLCLAEVVERRIAVRPRGVLPDALLAADDAIRRAAVRSVDDTASAATLLLVGWASLGVLGVAPDGALYDALAVFGSVTVLALSLWWAWRSSPERLLPGGPGDSGAGGSSGPGGASGSGGASAPDGVATRP